MQAPVLERVRTSLEEKREGIRQWLQTTPSEKVGQILGPAPEKALEAHLTVLDHSLDKIEEGTLGLCKVCNEPVEERLLEVDYTASVCISHFSPEEVRRLENELRMAQSMQKALLPQVLPDIPNLELAAYSQPAQIIGGDYFDFFEFGAQAQGIIIADVVGHGVSASLHMASTQATLRTLARTYQSPAEIVREIHKLFIHNIHFTSFVTAFIASYDPNSRTLTYCNAGHNPPLLLPVYRKEKTPVQWLKPIGPAIGMIEEAEFRESSLSLYPGDLLVMYTDGVTETMNADQQIFGDDRLHDLIVRLSENTANEIAREIGKELESFRQGAPLADDTTYIVVRIR